MDAERVTKMLQLAGALIAAGTAIGGTLVALGFDPVFRPQMAAAFADFRSQWQQKLDDLKAKEIAAIRRQAMDTRTRAISSQLQLNKLTIDALRKEQIDRDVQLKTDEGKLDAPTRSIIIQRFNDVKDKLEEAQQERQQLIKEQQQPQD